MTLTLGSKGSTSSLRLQIFQSLPFATAAENITNENFETVMLSLLKTITENPEVSKNETFLKFETGSAEE